MNGNSKHSTSLIEKHGQVRHDDLCNEKELDCGSEEKPKLSCWEKCTANGEMALLESHHLLINNSPKDPRPTEPAKKKVCDHSMQSRRISMRLKDDDQPEIVDQVHLRTWSKKVNVGTFSTSSGSQSQVKRDVASRRGGGA